MAKKQVGGIALRWIAQRLDMLAGRAKAPRGVILLAVLVFVALLLPLVTLVLTSINTESVSTAEAIKGAKAELAAEKAINDAIALVVNQKAFPDYYSSARQPNTAIIVRDPVTGARRNEIDTSAAGNIGAGEDDVYGTSDDYWIGPRGDRSFIGDEDNATASRNYRYDFAFSQLNAPTYIGQNWSYSQDNRPFAVSPFTGGTIWFFNQYAAVDSGGPTATDEDSDGVDDGYDVTADMPFVNEEPTLKGPGYYPGQDGGPEHPLVADLTGSEDTLLEDTGAEQAMYNAKVNLYESVFSNLDTGPLPTSMLKSYANVTDEAGRLNLNIFCKKVKVFVPESADMDYDASGNLTDDFNGNEVYDESIWKWMDNPLFPDRNLVNELDLNTTTGALGHPGGTARILDWGGFDITSGAFNDTTDGFAMPELGESVQHYYEGDTDGDGIPQSVESMRNSLRMLESVGLTPLQAARLLTYLNPPQDAVNSTTYPDSDPWVPGDPNSETYPTLNAELNNGVATLPYTNGTLSTDPAINYPDRRIDAANITPPLLALMIDFNPATGVMDEYYWQMDFSEEDDLPLPTPRPLTSIDQLLDIPGFTEATLDQIRDKVTIFSYDTNVIANYIADVPADADVENAYVEGDPQYNGTAIRDVPEDLVDEDNLADLRFDVSRYIFGFTMSDYSERASEMYAFIREHLPRPLFDKLTLPTVDRMGRADPADHMAANDDPRYDLNNSATLVKLLPHRDDDEHPYNVGELGHELDNGGEIGAGYPALNPAFSLDSCLSVVMYRNGMMSEEDDYNYNPQDGAWRSQVNRLPTQFFTRFLRRLSGPLARLLGDIIGGASNPDPDAGFNVNPAIRPHGANVMDAASLVNPGEMDSAADLLAVPLYKFSNMSISMMADPPSSFRWDRSIPIGSVTATDINEIAPVNYYIAFSDVVDYSWYAANVAPYGPDGREGTGDEPDESRVLYTIRFTYANRPITGSIGDISPNAMWDAVIPITPYQLRPLSGGTPDQGSKVTIGFFPDPAYDTGTNSFVGGKPLIDPDYIDTVTHSAVWANVPLAARPTGTLSPVIDWREVPLPEEDGSAGDVGDDADGRPNNAADWPSGYVPSAYTLQNGVTPWAYDENGDPYLTARCEVVNEWKNPGATPEQMERADDTAKVYLQYNERAEIPFRVSILPVRVSGSEFEIRSAFGGAQSLNGNYLLYDWDIPGFTTSYDGTWPESQASQQGDPRVIRVTPRDSAGGAITVSLRLYDVRAFVDSSGLPQADGYLPMGAAIWDPSSSQVFGRNTYDPAGTGNFPQDYIAAPGTPMASDPSETDAGYAYDAAIVESIDSSPVVRAQVTAIKPSIYRDDPEVPIRASAAGGEMNYTYRMRILNSTLGLMGSPGTPYRGPDAGAFGGDGDTWPNPFVTYGWEATSAMPRHSELSQFTFPNPPNAANYVALNHYDISAGGLVDELLVSNSDQLDVTRSFDFTGYNDDWYWVEVAIWDSVDSGGQVPGVDTLVAADAYAYTKVYVSDDREPAGSTGVPPELNASIWLRALDSTTPNGARPLGFNCGVAIDGGTGGYNYYWEVDGPVYDANNALTDVDIIERAAASGGTTTTVLRSNEPNPRFVFNADPDSYGTYFIHCYVMDHAASSPSTAPATVAHDVVMVTLNDTGGATLEDISSDPDSWEELQSDSLSRTPMAVVAARPPGNTSINLGENSLGATGSNRPYIGSTMLAADKPAVEPDIAGIGQTIIVRGYNFDPVAANNSVRFAGNIETKAYAVRTLPAALANQYDPPGPAGPYDQMELFVKVPTGALPGYLNVRTPDGASEHVFFQTGFNVTFDLIGSMSVTDPTMVQFELDFQGDGYIDYESDLVVDSGTPGIIDGSSEPVTHDYAWDGVGNYNATLIVTDLVSGRKQVSHQLITIKDLRPTSGFITIASGEVDNITGTAPNITLYDDTAFFLSMGTIDATWSILNTNTSSSDYGNSTTVTQALDDNNLLIGANIFAIGDTYEIRKRLADPSANGMLANAWPTVEMRSETFTARAGEGMTFNSAVGGVSSTGLKYKWAVNLNDITSDPGTDTDNDRIDFTVNNDPAAAVTMGGIPPIYIITTDVNWTYMNLPTLPFNVFDDSDGSAIWRVTGLPGNNVPGYGILGQNQIRVEYVSGGTGPFNWEPGEDGHVGEGAPDSGTNSLTDGRVDDVFGGANNPDYGRLDNILIDRINETTGGANDFRQVGPRGVSVGDIGFNLEDGSVATVYSIDSATQLRMDNGADASHVLGLLNGGPIGRDGVLTGRSPDLVPGAPFQAIYDITQNTYIWHGFGANDGEGGFIVGDGNPAVFIDENGIPLPYAGDSFFVNNTDFTAWEVIAVNSPTAPNNDTMRVQFMNTIPNPLGVVVGPQDGLRIYDVTAVTPLGGSPPVFVIDTTINWADLNLPALPFVIYNNDDGAARWRVTALPGQNVPGVGVLLDNQVRVEYLSGGALPYEWSVTDTGYIILPAQFAIGDNWAAQFPRNQWRANYPYRLNTHSGGIGGGDPQGTVWADCSFADLGAPVDFYVRIEATTGMALPATVEFDWTGMLDGVQAADDTVIAKFTASGTSGSLQDVKATHIFQAADLPPISTHGVSSAAQYRILTTAVGQNSPNVGPWTNLPIVIVGGDHYDLSLRTLNIDWNAASQVHAWDNTRWNHVTLETCYSISYNMMETSPVGMNNMVRRWLYAVDQMLVPPGMDNYGDTLTTWASYSKPFVYSNITGATFMRHQAVHGLGSALNWCSDANADARWRSTFNSFESPLDDNPVNYHEFMFQNGANAMSVPGAAAIKGASFPKALPGVGRADSTGGFIFYQATKGVYNGMAFVSDNLPVDDRGFSFDSQAFFWGDRVNASSTANRELRVDFYVDPLIGSNTQQVRLVSAVTSGSETDNYSYLWTVTRRALAGVTAFTWTNTGPNPVFNPAQRAQNAVGATDTGAGIYDVYLTINGSTANVSPKHTFEIRQLPLQGQLMANPPSGTVATAIDFQIFVEGGTPGYTVEIEYGDGDDSSMTLENGSELTFSHSYDEPGTYTATLTVTDAAGDVVTDTETVNIAETVPLNVTLAVAPPSGVAPFGIAVYYCASGGTPISTTDGNGYNVVVELRNASGRIEQRTHRNEANVFAEGVDKLNTILPGPKADPVYMTVPAPGNYTIEVHVTDDNGSYASDSDDVFASGYLSISTYGESAPQVVRDMENRPMHAVRVWRDPFLSRGESGDDEDYANTPDSATLAGGRMMEGDIQVLGDLLTTDPNQSFRSFGMNAAKDPISQPLYYADYSLSTTGDTQNEDYYDTFTEGRININTASEDVLTALFRRCVRQRGYTFNTNVYGQTVRTARNIGGDVYVTDSEARAMAQAVVKYRAAFYDMHKPPVSDAGSEFGYSSAGNRTNNDLGGSFRVDHLPVIGPWDGANPLEYRFDDRDAELQDADESINNAWDHMAASYYSFEDDDDYMFYSPSDIAFVRTPWSANIAITDENSGQSFSLDVREPSGNYAKYLNDTVTNNLWSDNRGPFFADWSATGLYNGTSAYSSWAYDARNYFAYSGGTIGVTISFPLTGSPVINYDMTSGAGGDVVDARNSMAIISSNGETAYTYITNPPFRSIYDLFNVIDAQQDPNTFALVDTGGGAAYTMELATGTSATLPDSTITNNSDLMENAQVFSGPSVFRYVAHWDNRTSEFITMSNYLDDIAPYITCRSYTFRVEAAGVVEASGGASAGEGGRAPTSRDRSLSAIIDVGPLWAQRNNQFSFAALLGEPQQTAPGPNYSILWKRDNGG